MDVSRGTDSASVIRRPDNYNPLQGEAERKEVEEAEAKAQIQAMIERDKLDPRQQYYLKNSVTGKLIRTNMDYHKAEENHHALVQITYNQAYDLYRKEEAVKKQASAKVMARKRAKTARKKNRPS
jgi:hypothetical protein